ncbi:unnamed protein product [Haemonchus placei]|uniref:Transcriptional regulator n=1 Tax=Haemonchus placei TaxID=6290 RepID=A0A0N4WPL6_HAEPC|nr:unnamed protein product [Haemonchus placei]
MACKDFQARTPLRQVETVNHLISLKPSISPQYRAVLLQRESLA